MVVVHLSSAYGSTSGTSTGPSGPSGQSTPITKFSFWSTTDYLCATKLFWGRTNVLYGDNSHGSKNTVELSLGEWVCAIYVDVDPQGILRGISFDSNLVVGIMTVGYIGDGFTTVINNSTYKWTDVIVYTGSLGGITVMWGMKFYYTTPTFSGVVDLALPALGLLAHSAVVASSISKVGNLRGQLSIAAPSCDPPQGTDPQKVQLWYRTFRAQENCKESFLLYAPSIMVASTFGREVFGVWAARAVGALSLVGAYFRYQYLTSYIESADKRLPPYYCASLAMKPVFYLAVVSCGYVVGKQAYDQVTSNFNLKLNFNFNANNNIRCTKQAKEDNNDDDE